LAREHILCLIFTGDIITGARKFKPKHKVFIQSEKVKTNVDITVSNVTYTKTMFKSKKGFWGRELVKFY